MAKRNLKKKKTNFFSKDKKITIQVEVESKRFVGRIYTGD